MHRLAGRPGCVRFDRHAVYLGDPSRSTCPPHLVGRTEAVHLTTAQPAGRRRPGPGRHRRRLPGRRRRGRRRRHRRRPRDRRRRCASTTRPPRSPPRPGRADARTFAAASDRATLRQRRDARAATRVAVGHPVHRPRLRRLHRAAADDDGHLVRRLALQGVQHVHRRCQPRLLAAQPDRRLGGPDHRAGLDADPDVRRSAGLLHRSYPNRIDPAQAAAQGTAAADDAIVQLNALGLGVGNPVYFDMEAFSYTNAACLPATRTFLDAWTDRLHDRGYVSGIYSSSNTLAATVFVGHAGDRVPTTSMPAPDAHLVRPLAVEQPDPARRPHPQRPGHPGPVLGRPPAHPPVPRRPPGDLGRRHREHRQQLGRRPRRPVPAGSRGRVRPGQRRRRRPTGSPVARRSRSPTGRRSAGRSRCRPCPTDPVRLAARPAPRRAPSCRAARPAGSGGSSRAWRPTSRPGRRTAGRSRASSSTRRRWTTPAPAASGTTSPAACPTSRTTGPTTFGTLRAARAVHLVRRLHVQRRRHLRRAVAQGPVGRHVRPLDPARPSGRAGRSPACRRRLRAGYTYCVSVRARNRAGQVSGWTGGRCLARSLDDRSLSRSSGWSAKSSTRLPQRHLPHDEDARAPR